MLSKMSLLISISAVLFLGMAVVSLHPQPKFALDDYEESGVCRNCHDTRIDLTSQWRSSMLSQAWVDPLFQFSYRQAGEDTGGKTDNFCPRCHTPVGYLTGNLPPRADLGKEGISCDFCHTIANSTGIGNGAYVSSPSKIKRAQYPDARSTHHETAYSDLHTRSEFCGMCHDVFDPENPGLMEQATYTEWKESSYPKRGIQCQHCMMNTVSGVVGASEAVMGPHQWVVFEHRFLGGHWEENLKKAALLFLEIDKSEVRGGDRVGVKVQLANVGCGHALPTGRSDLRELWLEVKAVDFAGHEVFSGRRVYGTGFADADGHAVGHRFWLAKRVLNDYRILPEEVKTETFNFAVPEKAEGPITLEAKLLYRLAPQEYADAAEVETLPIIMMKDAKTEIIVSKEERTKHP